MSRTSRRNFAKAIAAAGAALPVLAVPEAAAQQPARETPLANALTEVVRAQSGQHLTRAEMSRIASDFREYVPFLERLRAVKLQNSDEPDFTFGALTKR